MKNIPVMIPYIGKEEIDMIAETVKSGWVAQGPKVAEFEKLVCEHEEKKYGVATSSCTTSLHLALVALGIKEGDDVIVPSFTFVATPNSVMYTGAEPIFVDVNTNTYNMNVESLKNKIKTGYKNVNGELININTNNVLKAILVVNEFGLCAELEEIKRIADENNLILVEDSACAFGAKIGDKFEGSFSKISCLSFHPRKSITTGEGGMALTNDEKLYNTMKKLRSHGASVSEVNRHLNKGYLLPEFNELGYNYRMTDLSGAMGVAQMEKFEDITAKRREIAKKYDEKLEKVEFIKTPYVPEGYYHTYQSYVCMLDYKILGLNDIEEGYKFRNDLMEYLENNGVATRVGTHATHMLGFYKKRNNFNDTDLMGAYECDKLSITLPLYYTLTDEDQDYVISKLIEAKKSIIGE